LKKVIFSLCLAAGLAFGDNLTIENNIAVIDIYSNSAAVGEARKVVFDMKNIVLIREVNREGKHVFEVVVKVGDNVEAYTFYNSNVFTKLVKEWRKQG